MANKADGIWIGENSVIAIAGEIRIVFLRFKKDLIASILYNDKIGVVSVTYGHGEGWDNHNHTATIIKNGQGEIVKNNDKAANFIHLHSADVLLYDEGRNKITYTTHDKLTFEHTLAEEIEIDKINSKSAGNISLSIVEKMAHWSMGAYFETDAQVVRAGIDTVKYSVFYTVDLSGAEEFIYCRVGQNGYCEKGKAMLPTIEIRHHLTRMIEDNLLSIQDYKPNEDWFIVDGCSFPADGGWYWSIKKITDEVIFLQGCSGDVYEIHRK